MWEGGRQLAGRGGEGKQLWDGRRAEESGRAGTPHSSWRPGALQGPDHCALSYSRAEEKHMVGGSLTFFQD